jgi:putative ABC transport system permease protein
MNRLVVGNLLHRPLRSAISILAVAIEVAMILSIVGILFGQIEGSRRQTSGIGADLIVRPPNASFLTGVSGCRFAGDPALVCRKGGGDDLGH